MAQKNRKKGVFHQVVTIEKTLKHHLMEWGATAFGIAGAILNSQLNIYGFYLFCVGNILWMLFSWKYKHYGLLMLNMVFFILNIYGIIVWNQKLV